MSAAAVKVLIVEDVLLQAEICADFLREAGYETRIATTAHEGQAEMAAWHLDIAILDIELPDINGIELLRLFHQQHPEILVIVVTAHTSMSVAIEAMREGAYDFITKPYAAPRLTVTVKNALESRGLKRAIRQYREQYDRDRFFGFIGTSPEMQLIYRTIESVGPSRAPVFITGESGTGKELAAEALHRISNRKNRKLVTINCGAIPHNLVESEMFGHVKGAFTGAVAYRPGAAKLADGGTLFLDEIGELPINMQVKFLRFLQTGTFQPVGASESEKVDVRLVCATNRDPQKEVELGNFREDLFYRLYVVPLHLPPLRERGEDILLIAQTMLTEVAKEEGKDFRGFSAEVQQLFRSYGWPGNVRQLQNVIRSVVVLHDGPLVERQMLPLPMQSQIPPAEPALTNRTQQTELPKSGRILADKSLLKPMWQLEREAIMNALEHTGNDVVKAAALLELNASTIYRKLQTWREKG